MKAFKIILLTLLLMLYIFIIALGALVFGHSATALIFWGRIPGPFYPGIDSFWTIDRALIGAGIALAILIAASIGVFFAGRKLLRICRRARRAEDGQ